MVPCSKLAWVDFEPGSGVLGEESRGSGWLSRKRCVEVFHLGIPGAEEPENKQGAFCYPHLWVGWYSVRDQVLVAESSSPHGDKSLSTLLSRDRDGLSLAAFPADNLPSAPTVRFLPLSPWSRVTEALQEG